jgi:hypothetical protein
MTGLVQGNCSEPWALREAPLPAGTCGVTVAASLLSMDGAQLLMSNLAVQVVNSSADLHASHTSGSGVSGSSVSDVEAAAAESGASGVELELARSDVPTTVLRVGLGTLWLLAATLHGSGELCRGVDVLPLARVYLDGANQLLLCNQLISVSRVLSCLLKSGKHRSNLAHALGPVLLARFSKGSTLARVV